MRPPRPYMNPYLAGTLLGIVLFLAFFLTGNGLGASGGLSRVAVAIEDQLVPDHVDRTPYLLKLAGGEKNPLDHWMIFLTIGTITGGFLSGLVNRRVKIQTGKGPRVTNGQRWLLALIGGILMGYGARFARGCTSGMALSGGSVLAVGSWAFMMAVFGGAYLFAYQLRRVWNE